MEIRELYQRAIRDQWNPDRDIPWDAETHWDPHEEKILKGLLSNYFISERVAMTLPAALIPVIDDVEAELFMATQANDEARHYYTYGRRLEQLGVDTSKIYISNEAFKTVLNQLSQTTSTIEAMAGLQLILESFAAPAFGSHYRALEASGKDPITLEILKRIIQDEVRHAQFGQLWFQKHFEKHPEDREVAGRVAERVIPLALTSLTWRSERMKAAGIEREADVADTLRKLTTTLDKLGVPYSQEALKPAVVEGELYVPA